jgi:hypothetical protein
MEAFAVGNQGYARACRIREILMPKKQKEPKPILSPKALTKTDPAELTEDELEKATGGATAGPHVGGGSGAGKVP